MINMGQSHLQHAGSVIHYILYYMFRHLSAIIRYT
jgi:hypothetical protein